jgi:dephospho-CoA kinase
MKWIGLTGGIACGKSTVGNLLRLKGYSVIDADKISHDVVLPGTTGLKSVVQCFGPGILLADGTLNRIKLAEIVFAEPTKRKELENIIHPLIQDEVEKNRATLEQKGTGFAFYDIPLLFETHAEGKFDFIVVVTCDEKKQRARLKLRNNLSDQEIDRRLSAQFSLKLKEQKADFVIHNDGDEMQLKQQIEDLIRTLTA